MEVRELRIGNYVKFSEEGSIWKIEGIDQTGISVTDGYETTWIELETFEGIPLTEEWLLKFGFEKHGTFHESYILNPFLIEWQEVYKNYVYRKRINEDESIYLTGLKHFHQLQNLYFALTGTELTINQK